MNNNLITTDGYALFLSSPLYLKRVLKENKIRKKDISLLFDNNREFAELIMTKGAALPVSIGIHYTYHFDIYTEEVNSFFNSNEWFSLEMLGQFNLIVENDELWISAISKFSDFNFNDFDITDNIIGYDTMRYVDGKIVNSYVYLGQRIKIESGIYSVTIQGFKRKQPVSMEEVDKSNFGFGFQLHKIDSLMTLESISDNNTFKLGSDELG